MFSNYFQKRKIQKKWIITLFLLITQNIMINLNNIIFLDIPFNNGDIEEEKTRKEKNQKKKESLSQKEKELEKVIEKFNVMKIKEIERQRRWIEELNALKLKEIKRQMKWEKELGKKDREIQLIKRKDIFKEIRALNEEICFQKNYFLLKSSLFNFKIK
jgi:hypothetical protein